MKLKAVAGYALVKLESHLTGKLDVGVVQNTGRGCLSVSSGDKIIYLSEAAMFISSDVNDEEKLRLVNITNILAVVDEN